MNTRHLTAWFLWAFSWMASADAGFPVPPRLALAVRETAGIARAGEVVRSGVPIPRSLNLTSTAGLAILGEDGVPVPAEFDVLARWDGALSDTARPVQWLLVSFPSNVSAGGSAKYRLALTGGGSTTPPVAGGLSVDRDGDVVTVGTGAATFKLGGHPGDLFDEVRLPDGTLAASGGAADVHILRPAAATAACGSAQSVEVRHRDTLTAVVVVEGALDWPGSGGGGLRLRRRYVFHAGSPVAAIRLSVAWNGDRCPTPGMLSCDGDGDGAAEPNGVLLDRFGVSLTPTSGRPWAVRVVGRMAEQEADGEVGAGATAWVRQKLRPRRLDPTGFDMGAPPGAARTGSVADGAMLAAGGESGFVAVALNHMHRYEPQALRVTADGRVAVHLVDDMAWIGARQGLFAEMAVGVFPSMPGRRDMDRLLWAPLNRPLRAWPTASWFAASGAVDEVPAGVLPPPVAPWRQLVADTLSGTVLKMEEVGLPGVMTFGVFPRYWGYGWYDEVDCSEGGDPTPGEAWDDRYWCGTWTDYHQALSNSAAWAMASGRVEWLDELAFPGALRVLHTQVMQCDPSDAWFYCSQCPTGYGGYRADFNSSHAYFENLFLYYWFTGDETVVDTLDRGARSMRDYLCSRRPASPCQAEDPPTNRWSSLSGRVAAQWLLTFRFVGLAGADPSFLEDWKSGLARLATHHYVEGRWLGDTCGFITDEPLSGAGEYFSSQLWLGSFYDWNNLNRLMVDTRDAPVGSPAVTPSRMMASWARSLATLGPSAAPGADGTVGGPWPNVFLFRWQGDRTEAEFTWAGYGELQGSDTLLWPTGKSSLTAAVMRAARLTGDSLLRKTGFGLVDFALGEAVLSRLPLGKECALFLTRLNPAVAQYAAMYYSSGDGNADGEVDAADLVALMKVLDGGVELGEAPSGNPAGCDLNRDGILNATDTALLAGYLSSNRAGEPARP